MVRPLVTGSGDASMTTLVVRLRENVPAACRSVKLVPFEARAHAATFHGPDSAFRAASTRRSIAKRTVQTDAVSLVRSQSAGPVASMTPSGVG